MLSANKSDNLLLIAKQSKVIIMRATFSDAKILTSVQGLRKLNYM